jgi:hypothetical protein
MKTREVMTVQASESPHLTVAELAARWRTTPQAIYNKRHRRKAPRGFRSGKKLLFPISDVEAFEAAERDNDAQSNPAFDPTRVPQQAKNSRKAAANKSASTAEPGARAA